MVYLYYLVRKMKRYDKCEYCGVYTRMTREHVVPRCFGGQYKIWVCSKCNNDRGHSGSHPLFVKWVEDHPSLFWKAVETTRDIKQTETWLQLEGLV